MGFAASGALRRCGNSLVVVVKEPVYVPFDASFPCDFLAALSLATLARHAPSRPGRMMSAKAGENRLKPPSADFAWVPGLGYRSMLLLHGDRLTVLGADGFTIERKLTLPKRAIRTLPKRRPTATWPWRRTPSPWT